MKVGSSRIEKIFQECLETAQRGESVEQVVSRYPRYAKELLQRLETAAWLERNEAVFAARPGFISASRQNLIERLKRESSAEATRPRDMRALKAFQIRKFWKVLNLVSVALLMLALGFVGMQGYSFAETALPGDALYGVKMLGEKVRLEATHDPAMKAELNVDYAERRSCEIVELIFEGRFEYLTPTSADLKEHVRQADALLSGLKASDPSLSDTLSEQLEGTFTTQNLLLDLLIQSVPQNARLGVEEAMTLEVR
jgi:Domain of unknown function (DUF5667)